MGSAKRSMCATMLSLQAITLGLTTPVMISVFSVSVATAMAVGLGLALACLVVAGLLRFSWAYWIGFAIQAASLALGFVIPMMFALGAVFAALWAGSFFLGAKVDRERAERQVIEQDWAAEPGEP